MMIFLRLKDMNGAWRGGQKMAEDATSPQARPRGARPKALWAPRVSSNPNSCTIYSRTSRSIHENTFPPPQPSLLVRSHLGAFSGILSEGDSISEGFYLNTITLPMKRE